MTNLLRLRGADGSIADFEDRVKVEWFTFIGPPGANVQRNITALGCGASPGATASLNTDRYLYTTRHYQIGLWDNGRSILNGGSFAAVEAYAREFENQILKAKWHNLDYTNPTVTTADGDSVTACAVWLERQLYDQTRPEIWTMLTGTPGKTGRIHEERYGIPRIVLDLQLDVMEGAVFLDGAGFPIDGGGGGTAFLVPSQPQPPPTLYGGTQTISPLFF